MSNGFQSTILPAWCILEPKIKAYINQANLFRIIEDVGLSFALSVKKVPSWDLNMYEDCFLRSWDILFDWAVDKKVDNNLNRAMERGSWNRGVTTDRQRQKIISSFSDILI